MSAVRGFTTLQLLELAAIAEANRLRSTNQIPANPKTGQLEDLSRNRTVITQIEAFLAQGGRQISFPAKARGLKLRKYITGGADVAAWFNNGQLQPPFAAKSAEGAYIESQRGRIYDYLQGGALAYVLEQRHYGLDNSFGKQGVMSSASILDDVITSSWRDAPGKAPARAARTPQQNFQERINKVQQVWALTQRNQEPAAVERAAGGGRVGVKTPATAEDVSARANASNGFLAKNLAEMLAANVQRRQSAGVSASVLQQNQALSAAIRAAFNIPAGNLDATQLAQARQAIIAVAQNPAELHRRVVAMAQGNVEALREALWASLGDVSLRKVIGGLGIHKPENVATGKRDFVHSAGQARGAQGPFDVAISRYAFDSLFDAYVQRGAGGDRMPADAQARSNRRLEGQAGAGPRGVLGTNDKALQGLSLNTPSQVEKFIRKALQRQYTLEALKQGARALGVPVNESSVLQDAVIQQTADHILVSYNQQVQAGSALHTAASAAAARLRGYGDLRTAEAVAEARRAIVRTLDAQNGFMTEPCEFDAKGQVSNYSKRDLKRIAKANAVQVAASASGATVCDAISGVVPRAQPSADALSSGRRQERVIEPQPSSGKRSGQRSGRRAAAPSNALGAMAAPGQLSPNTQAAFAAFLPQPAAGGLLGGGAPAPMGAPLAGPLSPRSPGGSRIPRAGAQGLLGAPAQNLGAAGLMGLFGNQ